MQTANTTTPIYRLFVVEDERSIADPLSLILRAAGFAVETFYDGRQALARLVQGGPPDLVLTDIVMPGLDGVSLAQHILERWPLCKVLFLSGETRSLHRMHEIAAIRSQVHGLEKPASPQQIIRRILQLLPAQAHACSTVHGGSNDEGPLLPALSVSPSS